MAAVIPIIIGVGQAVWAGVTWLAATAYTVVSTVVSGVMNVAGEIWSEAVDLYDWVGNIDSLDEIVNLVDVYGDVIKAKQRRDQIKELEAFELEIPSMDAFEEVRDEMFDILGTDPDALSSTFDEATLRKYGIDPETVDAEAMIRKRGARAKFEAEKDAVARQFARTGAQGAAGLAAAQAQLGIQSAAMDAQMGLEAERKFTQQIAGVQQKYENVLGGLMTMEEQIAEFEFNRMQAIQALKRQNTKELIDWAGRINLAGDEDAATTSTGLPPTPPHPSDPTPQTTGGISYPDDDFDAIETLEGIPTTSSTPNTFDMPGVPATPPGTFAPTNAAGTPRPSQTSPPGTTSTPFTPQNPMMFQGPYTDYTDFNRETRAGFDLFNTTFPEVEKNRGPNDPGMQNLFMNEEDFLAGQEARRRMGLV